MRVGSKGQSGARASSSGLSKVQAASSARPWVAKVTAIEAKSPRAQVRERRAQATLELNTAQRWEGETTGQWVSGSTPHGQFWPPWGPLTPSKQARPFLPLSPIPGGATYQGDAGEVA